jgi:hypothetical protein
VEAIEPTPIRHELGSLGLKDLPDGPVGELWMPMRLGVGNTFIEQPGVQLVERLESQSRGEEPLADSPTWFST